ncbi:MAG: hypothetical protein WB661_04440 [Candidatus Bathyarchaeia archaeon]
MRPLSKPAASSFMFRPRRPTSETLSEGTSSISFSTLSSLRRKSLRSGRWFTIGSAEKALYRCALWVAKARGYIVNRGLVAQVLEIARHLLGSVRGRITAAGKERARRLLKNYSNRSGVFCWAPQVREWLHDTNYIFYLGVNLQQ